MTEYWVSQGNKWCEFCKIYIANNPVSIRTHEVGQRHKDNVARRLASMRKESIAKEREQQEAARALQQIETKAKKIYLKDLAAFGESKGSSTAETVEIADLGNGKWVSEDEAFSSVGKSKSDAGACTSSRIAGAGNSCSMQAGPPGRVISAPLNPMRSTKTAPSSVSVNKRKRVNDKPNIVSKEEKDALKAREAARKRVEAREAPLLGLYKAYCQ